MCEHAKNICSVNVSIRKTLSKVHSNINRVRSTDRPRLLGLTSLVQAVANAYNLQSVYLRFHKWRRSNIKMFLTDATTSIFTERLGFTSLSCHKLICLLVCYILCQPSATNVWELLIDMNRLFRSCCFLLQSSKTMRKIHDTACITHQILIVRHQKPNKEHASCKEARKFVHTA